MSVSECLRKSVSPAKKERGRETEKETIERVTQVWCILHKPLAATRNTKCDFILQISNFMTHQSERERRSKLAQVCII